MKTIGQGGTSSRNNVAGGIKGEFRGTGPAVVRPNHRRVVYNLRWRLFPVRDYSNCLDNFEAGKGREQHRDGVVVAWHAVDHDESFLQAFVAWCGSFSVRWICTPAAAKYTGLIAAELLIRPIDLT